MSKLRHLSPEQYVLNARKNSLQMKQCEFAKYLNNNKELDCSGLTQSTISKYENGNYRVPSNIVLHCGKLIEQNNSLIEYPVSSLIESIKKLDPINDFHILDFINEVITRSTSPVHRGKID